MMFPLLFSLFLCHNSSTAGQLSLQLLLKCVTDEPSLSQTQRMQSSQSSSPFHQSSISSPPVLLQWSPVTDWPHWLPHESRSWFRMLRDSFLHYVPPLYPTIPILHQIQISSPIQASSSSAFIRWWDDPSSSRDYLHWPIAVSCVVRVWEVKREFLHLHICMFRQTMITGHSRGDSEDIPDRDWTHDGRMKFSNYGWYRCIGAGQKDSDKSWYFINIFNALFVIASILSCLFNQSIVYKKFVQAIRKFTFYFKLSISFLKKSMKSIVKILFLILLTNSSLSWSMKIKELFLKTKNLTLCQ